MKFNLKDTTFLIPVRIDSIIRLENLLLTVDNIESNFDTNIVIIEAAYYNNGIINKLLSNNITYHFIEDKDPIFHRTKHLNTISKDVNTSITGIWDADVILESTQVIDSVQNLRSGKYDFAYPYDGKFLDTSNILRNHYLLYKDIDFLKKNTLKMDLLYSSIKEGNSVGGAFFISSKKYKDAGLENENFYGWGMEDGERYRRWLILNYSVYRSSGVLFHLSHPRDINSSMRSEYHYFKTWDDVQSILNSTKEELVRKFQVI